MRRTTRSSRNATVVPDATLFRAFQRPHGFVATDEELHVHVREDDDVPQRQNRKNFGTKGHVFWPRLSASPAMKGDITSRRAGDGPCARPLGGARPYANQGRMLRHPC